MSPLGVLMWLGVLVVLIAVGCLVALMVDAVVRQIRSDRS